MKTNDSKSFFRRNCRRAAVIPIALCVYLIASSAPLRAKEQSLTAIVVYQNASGWTYLQASDVQFNAKIDVRDCGNEEKIDKSAYGKLPKIRLGAPATLVVLDNGSLRYTKDNSSTCVVPDNIKFEKSASFTPAQLAGKSSRDGNAIDAAAPIPPFKPGMLMVFVSAPDSEYAEFLTASRASEISVWDAYLAKYPSAPHTKEAKSTFGRFLMKQSRAHLELYKNSASLASPAYSELQTAKQLASKANSILPGDAEIKSVNDDVTSAADAIAKTGGAELVSYQQALAAKTAGYEHLRTANHLLEELQGIDPQNPSVLKLETGVMKETNTYEGAIRSSKNLMSSHYEDEALKAVTSYLAFLAEDSRIAAVVNAAYGAHFNNGKSLSDSNNWQEATREFDLANKIKPSAEAASALANAKKELEKANNKAAAEAAIRQSKEFAAQNDFISAYEVLDNLPPDQRSLVDAERAEMGPAYVTSASQAAQQIQKAHDPIRGLADEKEVEKAYDHLNRSYAIDGQSALKERRDDLGDKLSDYYLQQAVRYIAKPMGSGVCIGWSYLEKAMPYKASNLESLRDEQTKTSATYQMRSRLSIRVEFRDQTSRRDSIGFAEQLADAIATGLENSGLPVKIVRPGDNPVVDANFRLVGDVVDHRKNSSTKSEAKESMYRAGEEQVPNDQWNAANRDYEAAKLELESARSVVQGATARGKKKEIAEAQEKVEAAEKKVNANLEKLDSIPKTTIRDIVKPYSYTEKKLQLSATVELRYRILDAGGQIIETSQPILGTNSQTVTILENVKPEDTENVRVQGTMPDENEFLIDVENGARDSLIKAARASVQHLPEQIFAHAQSQEHEGNPDAAAENYILYLNSTSPASTPERSQAEAFLSGQFNVRRKYGSTY